MHCRFAAVVREDGRVLCMAISGDAGAAPCWNATEWRRGDWQFPWVTVEQYEKLDLDGEFQAMLWLLRSDEFDCVEVSPVWVQ